MNAVLSGFNVHSKKFLTHWNKIGNGNGLTTFANVQYYSWERMGEVAKEMGKGYDYQRDRLRLPRIQLGVKIVKETRSRLPRRQR